MFKKMFSCTVLQLYFESRITSSKDICFRMHHMLDANLHIFDIIELVISLEPQC
jgi:hypothetical protein